MRNITNQIAIASYVAISIHFIRKIIIKSRAMFDMAINIVHEDDGNEYCVRFFHRYIMFGELTATGAMDLAIRIVNAVPRMKSHVDIVRKTDARETMISDVTELSSDEITIIDNIWMDF